jgi:acyl transferase domain-containing protein
MSTGKSKGEGIAIVGMAGRFPKARDLTEFWQNLCAGKEGISFFTEEELAAAGVSVPEPNERYVKARGVLEDADKFDAAFFGFNPKEAEVLDPQHRVFLECAWEALENAGCDPDRFDGTIGVFAGMSLNTYLVNNLMSRPDVIGLVGEYQAVLSNDKDFLPTRVSYKLNLKGPSLNIQTACSTSLVAVCVACQHLLNYQCDAALVGAVSIGFPQKRGYFYQEGGIASPDGHCRAFDAKAAGTVAGEGVGIVVLKRLTDALAEGDQIDAVIKGFAINNDGAMKIGYTAPSVEGQAEVIAMAQEMAGVESDTISYVEAHGTGTPLGDPIEIEGLTKAFRTGTDAKNFCAIGSVKSSIGHLDAAAGVAGLIKTVLALQYQKLPPSLHFEAPNPKIDFANSPFFVNAKLSDWGRNGSPRRAGVSSFGIGGTNAHVVVEEAPVLGQSRSAKSPQLLLVSAKTRPALDCAAANLTSYLQQNAHANLADIAYTLQTGRREFAQRLAVVCADTPHAIAALQSLDSADVQPRVQAAENPPIIFMFPGQGAQRENMGRELYESQQVFREQVDYCAEKLKPHVNFDLRSLLYPANEASASENLTRTANAQPALFVIEYALAKLWMSWGIEPAAMIGHSIGEYVAACLAGVFSLDAALTLVAARGRMMQQMPPGAMLAVRLPETEVQTLLGKTLSLSSVNGAALCVVSGKIEAVNELRLRLTQKNVACTLLHTSHAFHSPMMEPAVEPFARFVSALARKTPNIPFISNVTGTWITNEDAVDPAYWARHLRQTVRFAAGLGELLQVRERVLLEVGPGDTLTRLAKQHPARNAKTLAVASLASHPEDQHEALLNALGQLWMNGTTPTWTALHDRERRRVHLPAYPFERKQFWVEPAKVTERGTSRRVAPASTLPPEDLRRINPIEVAAVREIASSCDATGVAPLDNATTPTDQIAATLRALFSELSGLDRATIEGDIRFIELGFDSLFLTQASLAIEKRFGVQVAFRQLLTDFPTLNALARHISAAIEQSLLEEINNLTDEEAERLVQGVN